MMDDQFSLERAAILKAVLNEDLEKLTSAEDSEHLYMHLPIQLGPYESVVSAIMVASSYGNILAMRKLFEKKDIIPLYNNTLHYKRSLLLAAAGGHWECVCLLSQHGLFPEVHSVGEYPGSDEFILAAEKQDFDLIQDLLDRGVGTYCIQGVKCGNVMSLLILNKCPLKCIVSMIGHGVSVNQHDKHGFTALMTAVIAGRVEFAQALLQMNADVNLKDDVYSIANRDFKDKFGNLGEGKTALMYAVNVNSLECAILLLKHGIELDGSDKSGFTSLMHAVCARNCECVKYILNSGLSMDINAIDNEGKTALIHAACAGDAVCVELLLKAKADHTQVDNFGRSAFLTAVRANNIECAKLLLRFQPELDLDSKDYHLGCTALEEAAASGNAELLGFLIDELKARVEKDSVCSTLNKLLGYTISGGFIECVELLFKNGCDVEHRIFHGQTPIMYVCDNKKPALFHFLVKCGANVNAVDDYNTSVLMHAARDAELEVVEFLLKNGVDVNGANDQGETPLMLACMQGRPECVELLIEYGANVNAVNEKKESALMSAAEGSHLRCFGLILDAGADVDILNKCGDTIFRQVLETDSHTFLKALIDSGKLFEDGQLKRVHKGAYDDSDRYSHLSEPIKVLLMESRIFEWSRYPKSWQPFAAVVSGISPGVFKTEQFDCYDTPDNVSYKINNVLTPLQLAFLESQIVTIRFFLVNHYLTMQDYKVFTCNEKFQSAVNKTERMIPLFDQITSQPWSLQTLSFISVSTSIALSASHLSRAEQVDSLPIPDKFKAKLKFQGPLSRLCPSEWNCIGKPPGSEENEIQNLLSLTQPVWPYPENLTQCHCYECDGMGLVVQSS